MQKTGNSTDEPPDLLRSRFQLIFRAHNDARARKYFQLKRRYSEEMVISKMVSRRWSRRQKRGLSSRSTMNVFPLENRSVTVSEMYKDEGETYSRRPLSSPVV